MAIDSTCQTDPAWVRIDFRMNMIFLVFELVVEDVTERTADNVHVNEILV